MALRIPVAHDFICPWCWVALHQTQKLSRELGVEFEWLGYELFPEELAWPEHTPTPLPPANKPPVLSRFEFLLVADGLTMPTTVRPKGMRSFNTHQAVEYAKTEGVQDVLIDKLYRALYERGQEINSIDVLLALGAGVVSNMAEFEAAIRERRFQDKIVGFDDEAYSRGVYNVPTYFIGEERYAEQPYVVLRAAIERELSSGK